MKYLTMKEASIVNLSSILHSLIQDIASENVPLPCTFSLSLKDKQTEACLVPAECTAGHTKADEEEDRE